jgi:hypothetical protein
MLQRWRKNKYFGDGYLLSDSLSAHRSGISHLTSRAGQSTLATDTPYSLGHDWGAHFRCCARQGCQKLARIKMLVYNMFWDKTLSIIQTNYIIKAVRQKMPKWQKGLPKSWLLSSPPYARSGSKTADAASSKKAQTMSQLIFKPKRPISSPQGQFLWKDKETYSAGASFWQLIMATKASRRSISLPFCRIRLQQPFFWLQRGEI